MSTTDDGGGIVSLTSNNSLPLYWRDLSGHFIGPSPPPVSGHSLVPIDSDTIVLFGGIGPSFIRTNDVYVFHISSRTIVKHCYVPRVHHLSTIGGSGEFFPKLDTTITGVHNSQNTSSGSGTILSRLKKNRKGNNHPNDSSFQSTNRGNSGSHSKNAEQTQRRASHNYGPLPRERHSVCVIQVNGVSHMLLFGGISDGKLRLNDVWLLNMKTMKWIEARQAIVTSLTTSDTVKQWPPSPRYNSCMCALDNQRVLIFAGYDGNCTNDLFLLRVNNDYTIEWHMIRSPQSTDQIPEPRYHHSCSSIGNRLILVGGKTQKHQLNDIWMFDPESYYWTRLEVPKSVAQTTHTCNNDHFSPRHGHTTAIIGSNLIMYGGVTGKQYVSNVWICNLVTLAWTEHLIESKPPGRIAHALCKYGDNSVVCIGGIVDVSEKCFVARSNDMWLLETNICPEYTNIPFVNERRVNDYVIERLLGKGGQGSVFLCRNTEKSNALYALKRIIVPFNNNQGPERMIANDMSAFNEVLVTQAVLDHPNVLKTEKFFMEMNRGDLHLNIVMPYCSEGDLERYLRSRRQKMSELDLVSLMIQILCGVAYIHSRNVIHRDIKPSNVLCAHKVGSDSVVLKLADFGLAKNTTASEAKTVCGTLVYASPEVYNNESYNCKADIWSLGVLFVWLMTGRALDLKMSSNRELVPKLFGDLSKFCLGKEYVNITETTTNFKSDQRPEAFDLLNSLNLLRERLQSLADNTTRTTELNCSILDNTLEIMSNGETTSSNTNHSGNEIQKLNDIGLPTFDDLTFVSGSGLTGSDTVSESILVSLLSNIMRLEEVGCLEYHESDQLCRLVFLKDLPLVRVFLAARSCHQLLGPDNNSFDAIFVKNARRLLHFKEIDK